MLWQRFCGFAYNPYTGLNMILFIKDNFFTVTTVRSSGYTDQGDVTDFPCHIRKFPINTIHPSMQMQRRTRSTC